MKNEFSRTALIFGQSSIEKLSKCRVAVFGVGGVGGYAVEGLVRSGVGAVDLIDSDTVSITNINRQIIALHSTVGHYKVDVMEKRIADINPDCHVKTYKCFFLEDTANMFDFTQYDYVVDAVDTVKAKLLLAETCTRLNVPIISSMGAGNKTDPSAFQVSDIYKTQYDPLAKVMRRELKKRGVKNLKVVYSREQAVKVNPDQVRELLSVEDLNKRTLPGSNAFVPSAAGLLIASQVIKDLINYD